MSSNQYPDVAPATEVPMLFEEYADKIESDYAGMPNTPKAMATPLGKPQGLARFAVQSVHMRECFAEFLGTFIMILFGMGVNNQVTNSADA
ncbi:hypothetical protein BBJ28_00025716, partial [Nothophytophthora sp. Chile5]